MFDLRTSPVPTFGLPLTVWSIPRIPCIRLQQNQWSNSYSRDAKERRVFARRQTQSSFETSHESNPRSDLFGIIIWPHDDQASLLCECTRTVWSTNGQYAVNDSVSNRNFRSRIESISVIFPVWNNMSLGISSSEPLFDHAKQLFWWWWRFASAARSNSKTVRGLSLAWTNNLERKGRRK